jgi:UDPglucose 6-dehydrogenase
MIFEDKFPKIGIVGLGFVGEAIRHSCDWGMGAVVCVDSDARKGHVGTYAQLMECEGIFVCVPSPTKDDGTCDTSILEDVLTKLEGFEGVIISKVTAPPDVYQRLGKKYPNLVHAPEFLTAANANRDYSNAKWSIIGGSVSAYRHEAERIIKLTQNGLETIKFCSIGDAALAKYAINSFLATKVVFMNELYQLAEKAGLNYDIVTNLIKQDDRIGDSHMRVPGTDGSLGFGGYCFPKDTNALLKYAEQVKSPMNVLESAVKKNTLLRLTEPK